MEGTLENPFSNCSVCRFLAGSGWRSIVTSYEENTLCRFCSLPISSFKIPRRSTPIIKDPTGRFLILSSTCLLRHVCPHAARQSGISPNSTLSSPRPPLSQLIPPDVARRRCCRLASSVRRNSEWRSPIILAGLGVEPDAPDSLVTARDKRVEFTQPGRKDITHRKGKGTKEVRSD